MLGEQIVVFKGKIMDQRVLDAERSMIKTIFTDREREGDSSQ
jgi:hypothetical protein